MKNVTKIFTLVILSVLVYPFGAKAMTTADVLQQYNLFVKGDPVSPSVLGASAIGSIGTTPEPKKDLTQAEQKIIMQALKYTSTDIIPSPLLKQGNTGDDVTKLQLFLGTKGHFKADPTGKYGALTKEAVMKFQKAKGLKVDGKVGPMTKKKITEEINAVIGPSTQ